MPDSNSKTKKSQPTYIINRTLGIVNKEDITHPKFMNKSGKVTYNGVEKITK